MIRLKTEISSVAGMENNPSLGDVDLSGNQVASLAGLPTDTIHTLNLSQNQIAEVRFQWFPLI